MRDRCASSPEAPESILCLIAWTIRLMLRSPLLSMTCIWRFSCSVASGDALHERGFRMLPKHELLLAICELLIFPTFFAYLSALLHSLFSGAKACRIPIDGLGDLVPQNISTPGRFRGGCGVRSAVWFSRLLEVFMRSDFFSETELARIRIQSCREPARSTHYMWAIWTRWSRVFAVGRPRRLVLVIWARRTAEATSYSDEASDNWGKAGRQSQIECLIREENGTARPATKIIAA